MITNNAINIFTPGRNIVIGGDLSTNPWQRGISFSSSTTGSLDTADMFNFGQTGTAASTIIKVSDAPTVSQCGIFTQHSYKITVTTAESPLGTNNHYNVVYAIEGYDWTKLAQRPFTISFWVKSNLTGIFCLGLRNLGTAISYTQEYTINSANTWEKKIINISPSPAAGAWNYTNGIGLRVRFCLGAGSNGYMTQGTWQSIDAFSTSNQTNLMANIGNTFQFDLLQVEPGYTATPFDTIDQASVLMKCQRYYQKTFDIGTAAPANTSNGAIFGIPKTTSLSLAALYSMSKVNMRTTPTVIWYTTDGVRGFVRDLTASSNHIVNFTSQAGESSAGYPTLVGGSAPVVGNLYAAHYVADASL